MDVEVGAQPIDDAIRVPRVALRNGRSVYVMNDLDQLEIREVQIAWTELDSVLVTGGLHANERVVTSRIPTPVPNMLLRTLEEKPEAAPGDPSEPAAQATP